MLDFPAPISPTSTTVRERHGWASGWDRGGVFWGSCLVIARKINYVRGIVQSSVESPHEKGCPCRPCHPPDRAGYRPAYHTYRHFQPG